MIRQANAKTATRLLRSVDQSWKRSRIPCQLRGNLDDRFCITLGRFDDAAHRSFEDRVRRVREQCRHSGIYAEGALGLTE